MMPVYVLRGAREEEEEEEEVVVEKERAEAEAEEAEAAGASAGSAVEAPSEEAGLRGVGVWGWRERRVGRVSRAQGGGGAVEGSPCARGVLRQGRPWART